MTDLIRKLSNSNIPKCNPETEAFVFVYGTLLKGRANYEHYLAPANPIMRCEAEGFDLYELGAYPAAVEGTGTIKGELYKVTLEQLEKLDRLEGNGSLYTREKTLVTGYSLFEKAEAYIYVYNHSVAGKELIPYEAQPYKNEYVWYVTYGSNMCFERLSCYIEGGYFERNDRNYPSCSNPELPTEWIALELPYNMYFANFGKGAWKNSAVSFLDVDKLGYSYCRAYLINKNQLEHIHRLEGMGNSWYPNTVKLPDIDGIEAVTFTNRTAKRYASASEISIAYASTIMDGLMEMGESADFAFDYIKQCTSRFTSVCWTVEQADDVYEDEKNNLHRS